MFLGHSLSIILLLFFTDFLEKLPNSSTFFYEGKGNISDEEVYLCVESFHRRNVVGVLNFSSKNYTKGVLSNFCVGGPHLTYRPNRIAS